MNVVKLENLIGTERDVHCPHGGFMSRRILLKRDGMGYAMTHTTIPRNGWQHWHYKNHLEACYCISGGGYLEDLATGKRHIIKPGTTYVLDKHDDHRFKSVAEETVLLCVFNPPLTGKEVHNEDGSYNMESTND